MFDVKDHRLVLKKVEPTLALGYRSTPNKSGKFKSPPHFVVIHYTGGRSRETTVERFTKPEAKASAHLVIGKDGSITQMVDFDTIAWHAGESEWNVTTETSAAPEPLIAGTSRTSKGNKTTTHYQSLNRYSIGIELDNPGYLERSASGAYRTYWGANVNADDVIIAAHKSEPGRERGWHCYPMEQLSACLGVLEALFAAYPSLKDVLGHDDISPWRKVDPGPAFPMLRFRSSVIGRYCATDET